MVPQLKAAKATASADIDIDLFVNKARTSIVPRRFLRCVGRNRTSGQTSITARIPVVMKESR